jgi:hypothetical protein
VATEPVVDDRSAQSGSAASELPAPLDALLEATPVDALEPPPAVVDPLLESTLVVADEVWADADADDDAKSEDDVPPQPATPTTHAQTAIDRTIRLIPRRQSRAPTLTEMARTSRPENKT